MTLHLIKHCTKKAFYGYTRTDGMAAEPTLSTLSPSGNHWNY